MLYSLCFYLYDKYFLRYVPRYVCTFAFLAPKFLYIHIESCSSSIILHQFHGSLSPKWPPSANVVCILTPLWLVGGFWSGDICNDDGKTNVFPFAPLIQHQSFQPNGRSSVDMETSPIGLTSAVSSCHLQKRENRLSLLHKDGIFLLMPWGREGLGVLTPVSAKSPNLLYSILDSRQKWFGR